MIDVNRALILSNNFRTVRFYLNLRRTNLINAFAFFWRSAFRFQLLRAAKSAKKARAVSKLLALFKSFKASSNAVLLPKNRSFCIKRRSLKPKAFVKSATGALDNLSEISFPICSSNKASTSADAPLEGDCVGRVRGGSGVCTGSGGV